MKRNRAKYRKHRRRRFIPRLVLLAFLVLATYYCETRLAGRMPPITGEQGSATSEPNANYDSQLLSLPTVLESPDAIPAYDGEDYIVLSEGMPNFSAHELAFTEGEAYAPLDTLGRCGPAMAMLTRDMMPDEERGEIGSIKPSGWQQEKYPGMIETEPPYLYNRCHLIAYAMTGQNDNDRNLITGTSYMNTVSMLEFERRVLRCLHGTHHHVLYRVTPYFMDGELVARGVEMEACSVEDDGADLCFHVFVYNHQPGIRIDYRTGASRAEHP